MTANVQKKLVSKVPDGFETGRTGRPIAGTGDTRVVDQDIQPSSCASISAAAPAIVSNLVNRFAHSERRSLCSRVLPPQFGPGPLSRCPQCGAFQLARASKAWRDPLWLRRESGLATSYPVYEQ